MSPTFPAGAPDGEPPTAPPPTPRSSRVRERVLIAGYNAIFLVVLVLLAPVLIWRQLFRRRYRSNLWQRMGFVPRRDAGGKVLWVHGVSVGEVRAVATLVNELQKRHPDWRVVLSSTTPTGIAVARAQHPDLTVFHYPIDFAWVPGLSLDRVQPSCILLVEREFWPNFLRAATRRDIPVGVVNGRISDRSFRGYQRLTGWLPQLDRIRLFCVQDDVYRERLQQLGIDPRRLRVTGNLKYDAVHGADAATPPAALRPWLAAADRPVLIGGSTHPEEEVWLVEAARRSEVGRRARIVLVPRHPERGTAIAEQLQGQGLKVRCWSDLMPEGAVTGAPDEALPADAVLIVDTIGQLIRFYRCADVAYVGGSLVPRGGQNMLEPAALGKAVLFGPLTHNFRNDVRMLLQGDAAVQVADRDELAREIQRLLEAPDAARALGERAMRVIQSNHGATERTLACLTPLLAES